MRSSILFTFFSAFLFCTSVFAQKEKPKLEAETYIVELSAVATDNKPPAKGKPDQISFRNGKMKSDFFDEKGDFKACTYTILKDSVDADEDRYIEFESILKNNNEEEVEVKGTVIGYNIEGEAKWSKGGKIKKEFTFAGGIKKGK